MSSYSIEKIIVGIIALIIVCVLLTKVIALTENLKAKAEQRNHEIIHLLNN